MHGPPQRIIDFHTHPYRPEDFTPGTLSFLHRTSPAIRAHGERLRDPQYCADLLRAEGVEHAVLLAEHCPQTSGNVRTETVLEHARATDGFYIPFASIDPNTDGDPAGLLRHYLAEGPIRGLKLYPSYQLFYPNDQRAYPLYEICVEHSIPLLLHIGSSVIPGTRLKYCDPIHLDDLAVDFPELTVVMAHGGRGFWYQACEFLALHHRNFYIDVTGLVPARLREHFPRIDRLGPKLLFGSDWPAMPRSVAENVAAVQRLGLEATALEAMLRGTARRLLHLA